MSVDKSVCGRYPAGTRTLKRKDLCVEIRDVPDPRSDPY